ncbi:MAG: flagellar hook-associated protein FlgL [Candidatus Scalindua sp.]|nr:flagellar hook-associated protein FlgL [Candidatus Scalindua sp.]
MTAKVTLETLVNTTLRKINSSTSRMQQLQEQISSGKKINRPSDGPADARRILSLNTENNKLEQYSSNILKAKEDLAENERVLVNVSEHINRLRELTVQGNNDTNGLAERNSISIDINAILESLLQEANAKSSGDYTFAGTKTTTKPFTATYDANNKITGVSYEGNQGKIEYRVGPGATVQINQTGEEAFIDTNLFTTVISIRDSFENGVKSSGLDELINAHVSMTGLVAKAGSVARTLELTENRIEDAKLSIAASLGETEGADLTEVVLRLKEQENIFQATLASSTLIFSTSILDYL